MLLAGQRLKVRAMNVKQFIAMHNGDGGFEPSEPSFPVDFLPGSFAKIEAMQERVLRGESVFHPDDLDVRTHGYFMINHNFFRKSFYGID